MAWLLLCHAAALAAFWWLPGWAARRDAALFAANPTSDDYHRVFHRQRLLERAGIFAAVVLLTSIPCMGSWWAYVGSCVGLLCAGAGIWAYRFNPLLNVARGLAYVPEYYVSPDPRAALFPDRYIWQRAVSAIPPWLWNDAELAQQRADYAATLLRRLLTAALVAGIVLYLLAVAAGFCLHRH